MTYEELLINIDLKGYENVLLSVGKTYFDNTHWFVVCDDGDCHLFDRYGNEDDIKKVIKIYESIIPKDIKKIVIPNRVTRICNYAFWNCGGLTYVTISDRVTSIGYSAFRGCKRLISMKIPNSVTSIKSLAFYYCSKLTNITIPNSIMSIGDEVFYGCINLKSLIFKGKSLDQIRSMENYPFGIEDESIIKCI